MTRGEFWRAFEGALLATSARQHLELRVGLPSPEQAAESLRLEAVGASPGDPLAYFDGPAGVQAVLRILAVLRQASWPAPLDPLLPEARAVCAALRASAAA